jgi:hypothetical protein
MTWRRPQYTLLDLVLLIATCGLSAALFHWTVGVTDDRNSLIVFIVLEAGMIVWFIAWTFVRKTKQGPVCEECGKTFLPLHITDRATICPRCKRRAVDPAHMRKEVALGFRLLLFIGVLVIAFWATLLSGFVWDRFRTSYWIVLPLVSVGATLGLVLAIVLAHVIKVVVRTRLASNERYALAVARKSAGEAGRVARNGPDTCWYSGAADPVPMLQEQREISRKRFESLLAKVETERPLRIFCFGKLDSLVKYHWHFSFATGDLTGFYLGGRHPAITISTQILPHRLADPERTARILFSYYFMEMFKNFFPPPWLSHGLGNVLASGGDGAELAHLNRRMLASLTRGTSLASADLLHYKPRAAVRHLNRWHEHGIFAHYAQFSAQSWSLVEYLAGMQAPEGFRVRFRAFAQDLGPKQPADDALRHHFGCGFEELVENWKKWVVARGIGTHEPAPPALRDALLERVIPTVRDRQAKIMDRIQAIRDMGRVGYALGADALIDLLRPGSEVPQEEIVWALEAISGMAWGDEQKRWKTWWEGLPPAIRDGGA